MKTNSQLNAPICSTEAEWEESEIKRRDSDEPEKKTLGCLGLIFKVSTTNGVSAYNATFQNAHRKETKKEKRDRLLIDKNMNEYNKLDTVGKILPIRT